MGTGIVYISKGVGEYGYSIDENVEGGIVFASPKCVCVLPINDSKEAESFLLEKIKKNKKKE
ncbi:MAG: hypothetical protein ACP5T9_05285 [Thermoplasmata archaeon]